MVRKNDGVLADASAVVYSSHWHAGHMIYLFNEDVTSIQTGDALCVESSADETAKSTTTYRDLRKCVVLGQQISGDNVTGTLTLADGSQEWFYAWGEVPGVQVTGSVVANEYLYFSTTARKLVGSGVVMSNAAPPQGAVGFALDARTGAGLVRAYLFDRTVTEHLNNFAATTNPSINDDVSLGYSVGSLWRNTTLNIGFRCIDNTDGAATWILTTPMVAAYKEQFNLATEVTVASFLIPRKSVGANGEIIISLSVLCPNNSGAGRVYTIKAYWNGVAEDTLTPTIANGAGKGSYKSEFHIRNKNAANSQGGFRQVSVDTASTAEDTAVGSTVADLWLAGAGDTNAGEVEFKLTIAMATADAAEGWELIGAVAHVLYRA